MGRILAATCAGLIGLHLIAAESVPFAAGEWEPYTGQQMEGHGMVAEIVTAACAAGGLQAQYDFFPWRRAEAKVEAGTHFATFPYRETSERTGKFIFSETLCKSSNGILLRTGNPRTSHLTYAKPEDLKGFRVGCLAGSDAVILPLRASGIQVEEVQTLDQNIQKLGHDRIDCIIDDRPAIYQALRRVYGSDTGKLAQFHFTDKDYGETVDYKLLVSVKYPGARRLLERFNGGLKKIKASGAYRKILQKYGL